MTKTYLGYGYTNNRGVARLQYAPNGEELTHSGYKNNNDYDTDVTAKFTNKTKEYESNKKHYPTTDPHIEYILYDDQTTDKTNEYVKANSATHPSYMPNEYIYFSETSTLKYNTPIVISNNEQWTFEAEEYIIESSSTGNYGIRLMGNNYNEVSWYYDIALSQFILYVNGDFEISTKIPLPKENWYKIKGVIENGDLFVYWYDDENNLLYSTNCTFPQNLFDVNVSVYYPASNRWRNISISKMGE